MPVTVDHRRALAKLHEAWAALDNPAIQPTPLLRRAIEAVMAAPDITFKYILVTGFLAKCIEPRIHTRALQTRSALHGAYDARSLCHRVIVGFEKGKGNLFGLSNEPFVNKPARHPEHDKDNPQLKNRALATALHNALELANRAPSGKVFAGLVYILRLASLRAGEEPEAEVIREKNLRRVVEFVERFLSTADGGARLTAVWAAMTELLAGAETQITVSSPNRPDAFAKSAGDVEVTSGGRLLSATECKHRPLTVDDVSHGIRKAAMRGCAEYLFVCGAGLAGGQESEIEEAIARASERLDVAVLHIYDAAPVLAAVMNPERRASFGLRVSDYLRQMRKFDSANAAAELWNRLGS